MDLPSRIDKKGKRAVLTGMELVAVPQLTAMGFDKITELILTRNRLKSLASLGSLPNVKTLDVSFNMLKSVTAAELPAKLQILDVSYNPDLVQVAGLPSTLALFERADTPALGYPPANCLLPAKKATRIKGTRLTTLKRWMEANPDPTRRLYPSEGGVHWDMSIGSAGDPCVQGKPMEDRHGVYFEPDAKCEKLAGASHVVAVEGMCVILADGHLGNFCADLAVAQLPDLISKAGVFTAKGEEASTLLAKTVTAFDEGLCDLLEKGKLSDGSTLVVAVVTREGMVHSCWLGDSRVLLGHADGTYTALTNDHKPDMPSERQRIEAIGGKVSEKEGGTARVEGVLAMSRSLGDVKLKRPKPFVSNVAETISVKLRPGHDTSIILASDGLWDVCSNTLAARTVHGTFTAAESAKKLLRTARLNGTGDNTLCVVVKLDTPTP